MTFAGLPSGRRAFLAGGGAALLAPLARRAARATGVRRVLLAYRRDALALSVPVATALGLFAEFGLEIEPVEVTDTAALAGLLRDGHADACVGPALQLLGPLHDGLDARLTTGISGGGLRLLATRRSGLRHIEDVAHRRIGVGHLDGVAKLFFSVMMRRKGIDPFTQVTWIEIVPDKMGDALRDSEVDAVAASDANGFFLREALSLTEIASNVSGSYRDRTDTVLAIGSRMLDADAHAALGMTRALGRAASWIAASPDDAAVFAAPLAPDLDVFDRARMIREEAPTQHPTGDALVEDIAAYADELRLLGLLPFELDAGRFSRSVCVDVSRS